MKQKHLLLALLLVLAMPWAAKAQSFSGGSGTTEAPYQIANSSDWDYLANNISTYQSNHFVMTANIATVGTMVGTSEHPFQGTFNGQGHTLTVNINGGSGEQGVAPFRYIKGATIENLNVTGRVDAQDHHAAGLVGFADNTNPATAPTDVYNTIHNCHVSTSIQTAESEEEVLHIGGIIGHAKCAQNTIEGCIFDGSLYSEGLKGGMVGWSDLSKLTLTNSLFLGTNSSHSNIMGYFDPVACKSGSYNGQTVTIDLTITNFYYNTDRNDFPIRYENNWGLKGTAYATGWNKHAYTIAGVPGVTVGLNGNPSSYNVSGITIYNGTAGMVYNSTIYAGIGEVVSLNLSGSDNYQASQGTLTGDSNPYTLTMAAANTVIYGNCLTVCDGTTEGYLPVDGTDADDYQKNEFIIPASMLSTMAGGTISSMSFYLKQPAEHSWGNARFQVFLKEVAETNYSNQNFIGTEGATTVYTGALDATGSTMDVNFTTPYTYRGGNLLVGIYETTTGVYYHASFYGINSDNSGLQNSSNYGLDFTTGTIQDFLPKTTFFYEPPITEISSQADWDVFRTTVNNGGKYTGRTVRLNTDVTATQPIGIDDLGEHSFNGTFDGQGHTITLNMTATSSKCGLFAVLDGATVQNLNIQGSISNAGYAQIGGLAGYTLGTCTITNCLNNVNITSTYASDICGGFIAEMDIASKVTFNGCAFTGTLNGQNICGGFVGLYPYSYTDDSNTCELHFNNSLFASTNSICTSDNKAPFSYNNGIDPNTSRYTISNSYYTTTVLGTQKNKQAYTITGGAGVTVSNSGLFPEPYDVSGITGYSDGIKYNDVLYAGNGELINLRLTGGNTYQADHGTLTPYGYGYRLTMTDHNTIIYAMPFTKSITGHGGNAGQWYLIASPINGTISANDVTNLINTTNLTDFDLYAFDQTKEAEWINWKNDGQLNGFDLESGKGYLYANKENVMLSFSGTPYNGNGEVTIHNYSGHDWAGWNLVGNPFGVTAYPDRAFYVMNPVGRNEIILAERNYVEAMEGIFVVATDSEETLTFSTTAPAGNGDAALNISAMRQGSRVDMARVSFGGSSLPKFQLNPSHTKVYIPQYGKEYAVSVIASDSEAIQKEIPVNFKAEENGTYTLTVSLNEVEANYLHLIDNMTGMDIDLTQTPSYTFEAKTSDYESRFRLVFSTNSISEDADGDNAFAYYNGSSWTVNNPSTGSGAEDTLQVVDVMGRVLSSETISGNAEVSLNQPAGVYMLRLINGDSVRVQKVVVR